MMTRLMTRLGQQFSFWQVDAPCVWLARGLAGFCSS
jgi:hypothetical protein